MQRCSHGLGDPFSCVVGTASVCHFLGVVLSFPYFLWELAQANAASGPLCGFLFYPWAVVEAVIWELQLPALWTVAALLAEAAIGLGVWVIVRLPGRPWERKTPSVPRQGFSLDDARPEAAEATPTSA